MERAFSMREKVFTSDADDADGSTGGAAGGVVGSLLHAATTVSTKFFRKTFHPKNIQILQVRPTHSLTHSLTDALTHSLIHSYSVMYCDHQLT